MIARLLKRKRVLAGLGVVAMLVVAGSAFAYFTSTGSGTGSATVGSASNWTVTPATATGGPLYPGSGSMVIDYTVTNASSGHQDLTATSSTVASSGGNVTQAGVPVTGCLAAWFTATNTPPTTPGALPQDLAGGASETGGYVTVTMTDAAANQNVCQGVKPDITISAS
jgi:hypothetical protein